MKYLSIDIETTGLDFEKCQVIELGIIADDLLNQLPLENLQSFHCYIDHRIFRGEPYALAMHSAIFRRIATREAGFLYLHPVDVSINVGSWLNSLRAHWFPCGGEESKKDFNVAGKNFGGFDFNFLYRLPGFFQSGSRLKLSSTNLGLSGRILDSGNHFWLAEDTRLPDTKTCNQRAGLHGEVAHTALEDALNVVKLVRIHHNKLHALQQFIAKEP